MPYVSQECSRVLRPASDQTVEATQGIFRGEKIPFQQRHQALKCTRLTWLMDGHRGRKEENPPGCARTETETEIPNEQAYAPSILFSPSCPSCRASKAGVLSAQLHPNEKVILQVLTRDPSQAEMHVYRRLHSASKQLGPRKLCWCMQQ